MGFISEDARGEERQEEVKKQRRGCKIGRSREMETESGEKKKERGPKGDRVIGMFSHVCPLERHQSSLSLLDFLYLSVFPSVITPCHLPGDSSETLGGRAPLGFIEYLPLRSIIVHNDTRAQRNKRAGK